MSADGGPVHGRERDARELALLRLLRAVGERLARARTYREVAIEVVAVGRNLLGATAVRLWRREEDELALVGHTGAEDEPPVVLDAALPDPARKAARSGEPLWLADVRAVEPSLPWKGTWAALPLSTGSRITGCLELLYERPRDLDASARELMLAVAAQVAEALERARLCERERTFPWAADEPPGPIARELAADHEAEQFREHLIGIVSHDLRTPLSALRFGCEALVRMGAIDDRGRAVLDRMRSSTTNMERIVGDLLDFTLASSGPGIPILPVEADLDQVCRDAVDELQRGLPGAAIDYQPEPDGRGVWDPQRLRQMVANLIGNAVKYGSREPPPVLRWHLDETKATIHVRNAGAPLPGGALPTLFEPLHRGSRADKHGTGLGLFIARHIARRHGGEITVESGPTGTLFQVTLPRRAQLPSDP